MGVLFWSVFSWYTVAHSIGLGYVVNHYLMSPERESIACVNKPEFLKAWIIFSLNGFFTYLMLPGIFSLAWSQSFYGFSFGVIALIVAAFNIAMENDFRLKFPKKQSPSAWKDQARFLAMETYNHVIANKKVTGLRILKTLQVSVGTVLVFTLLFGSVRNQIWNVMNPLLYIQVSILVAVQFVLADIICFASNLFLMRDTSFPFPTPYFFSDARADIVNLSNAMATSNLKTKLFAFRDFVHKARSDAAVEFFTLSNPGKHPRFWTAVVTSCTEVIETVINKLNKETETTLAKNSIHRRQPPVLNNDQSTIKSSFLVPPTLKPKTKTVNNELVNLAPIKNKLRPYWNEITRRFIGEVPVVPTIYLDIAEYAVEGLSALLEASYTKDTYGVAHRGFPIVLAGFIELANACDQLIRAKSMRANSVAYFASRIFQLRNCVIAALQDIYTAFEKHIDELDLTPNQVVLLKEYANLDRC